MPEEEYVDVPGTAMGRFKIPKKPEEKEYVPGSAIPRKPAESSKEQPKEKKSVAELLKKTWLEEKNKQ